MNKTKVTSICCFVIVFAAAGSYLWTLFTDQHQIIDTDADRYSSYHNEKPDVISKDASTSILSSIDPQRSEAQKVDLDYEDNWCDIRQLSDTAIRKVDDDIEHLESLYGYYSYDDVRAYLAYDRSALMEIAESDNLIAIRALYISRPNSDNNIADIKNILSKAIAVGSTEAIKNYASVLEIDAEMNRQNLSSEDFRNRLLNALSIYRAGIEAGDPRAFTQSVRLLSKHDMTLSESEKKEIDKSAEDFLNNQFATRNNDLVREREQYLKSNKAAKYYIKRYLDRHKELSTKYEWDFSRLQSISDGLCS